ncbi:MAG: DUF4399 domain-containing protein [Chloroflexi bacterium]|nr:DUF4399 domain-containing protein [Chloroflexota bacterium]
MLRRIRLSFLVIILATGCASAATPGTQGPPSFEIVSPASGAEVQGPTVTIELEVTNFIIKPADGVPQPNEGHFHVFVDGSLDYDIVYETTHTLTLSPGEHTVRVEARDNAHFHLNPRLVREVTFIVTGEYAVPTPEATPTPYTEYRE